MAQLLKCAFTGHRVLTEEFDEKLLFDCIKNLIENGVDTFYCGMAVGFDLIAAQCVIDLKIDYPYLKLIACIPCEGQERYFEEDEKTVYQEVLSKCSSVIVLSKKYYKGCMQVRDQYMVDNSDVLVAFLRCNKGGTHYTVSYAEKKNKQIYII
jgi:uncharacterized phage-like protein YoqJ